MRNAREATAGILLLLIATTASGAPLARADLETAQPAELHGATRAAADRGSLLLAWQEPTMGFPTLAFAAGGLAWERVGVEERSLKVRGDEVVHVDTKAYREQGPPRGDARVEVLSAEPGAFLLLLASRGALGLEGDANGRATLSAERDPLVAAIDRGDHGDERDAFAFRHAERGAVLRLQGSGGAARAEGDLLAVLWGVQARIRAGDGVHDLRTGAWEAPAEDGVTTRHVWEYAVLRLEGARLLAEDPRFLASLVAPAMDATHEGWLHLREVAGVLEAGGVRYPVDREASLVLRGAFDLQAAPTGEGAPRLALRIAGDLDPTPLQAEALTPTAAAAPLPLGPVALAAAGLAVAGGVAWRARLPQRAAQRRQSRSAACREAADALLQAGKPREARPWYEAALRAEPRDPASLAGRGACLLAEDRLEEALRCFTEALARRPDDGAVTYACASLSARLGRREEAQRWLQKAATLAPEHARRCLTDPAFIPLRGHREFREVAQRLQAPKRGDESIAYH